MNGCRYNAARKRLDDWNKARHYEITSHLGTGGMGEVYQGLKNSAGEPIPVDETLRISSQIAEALEAAHEKG